MSDRTTFKTSIFTVTLNTKKCYIYQDITNKGIQRAVQNKIYTGIQNTNSFLNGNVTVDIKAERCILCVISVLVAAVELLTELFLFGPKPPGEPFPFLCLLRGFFFTPFGVFPINKKEHGCLVLVNQNFTHLEGGGRTYPCYKKHEIHLPVCDK
jgi:hypothetical protein